MSDSSSESDNDNPVCWYGSSCYRKNPDHIRRFSHPKKSTNSEEKVIVKVEVGHRSFKKGQDPCKYWTAFVRGVEGNNIEHFVEKVVFNLPENFLNPKRTIEKAPFQLTETSLSSFVMTIDLYFKCDQQTKMTFTHDLTLRPSSAISIINVEKLTFKKPTADFCQKLLDAGGQAEPVSVEADSSSTTGRRNDQPSHSSNKRKRESSSTVTSEVEAFSKTCASKLFKIGGEHPTQRIIAEKLISDVLYQAQLNLLTTSSCITSNNDFRGESRVSSPISEADDEPETTALDINVKVEPRAPDSSVETEEPETIPLESTTNQTDMVRVKREVE